jgi:hypothetical protein
MKKIAVAAFAAGAVISVAGPALGQGIYFDFGPRPRPYYRDYDEPRYYRDYDEPRYYRYGERTPGAWVLSSGSISNLERLPARLDGAGRSLQTVSGLLARLRLLNGDRLNSSAAAS